MRSAFIRALIVLTLALGFVACTMVRLPQPPAPMLASARTLEVPPDWYHEVLRFPDGRIFLHIKDLRYYVLGENRVLEIPFPWDKRCVNVKYDLPKVLPDGRLAFREFCGQLWRDRPLGLGDAHFLVAYDWQASRMIPIIDAPLPPVLYDATWSPDMQRGVVASGSLDGTLSWLTPQGIEPMTITVGAGDRAWRLDVYFPGATPYPERDDVGIARNPAWSPDGQYIAFWASSAAIGKVGLARAVVPYDLYLLDPKTLAWRVLTRGVSEGALTYAQYWSPDSQWILFSGGIGGETGLWIVSPGDGQLQLVDRTNGGAFAGFNWRTDHTIVAVKCTDSSCYKSSVLEYDVSLLQSDSER